VRQKRIVKDSKDLTYTPNTANTMSDFINETYATTEKFRNEIKNHEIINKYIKSGDFTLQLHISDEADFEICHNELITDKEEGEQFPQVVCVQLGRKYQPAVANGIIAMLTEMCDSDETLIYGNERDGEWGWEKGEAGYSKMEDHKPCLECGKPIWQHHEINECFS